MHELILERTAILIKIAELLKTKRMKLTDIPLPEVMDYIKLIYEVKGQAAGTYSALCGQLLMQGIERGDSEEVANLLLLLGNSFSFFAEDMLRCATLQDLALKRQAQLAYYQNRDRVNQWKQRHTEPLGVPFQGKGVVYSAIIGGYDEIKDPAYVNPEFDYIMFTDNPEMKSDVWQIRLVDHPEGLDNVRLARRIKILGHEYLQGYDYSIWVDGKLEIMDDLKRYINEYKKEQPILCFNHYMNDCIYQEAETCKALGKDGADIIDRQMEKYRSEGYPEKNGQVESGIIVRQIHDEKVIAVMELWWKQVLNYSRRDQLSFNYACWKCDFVYDSTDLYIYDNEYVRFYNHK